MGGAGVANLILPAIPVETRDWAGTSQVDVFLRKVDQYGAATFFTLD